MVTLGEKAKVKFIAVNFLFVFALEIKERKHDWIGDGERSKKWEGSSEGSNRQKG